MDNSRLHNTISTDQMMNSSVSQTQMINNAESNRVGNSSIIAAVLNKLQDQIIAYLQTPNANQNLINRHVDGTENHLLQFPRHCSFYHSIIHTISKKIKRKERIVDSLIFNKKRKKKK